MHLGLVIPKEGCKIRCANETSSAERCGTFRADPPGGLSLPAVSSQGENAAGKSRVRGAQGRMLQTRKDLDIKSQESGAFQAERTAPAEARLTGRARGLLSFLSYLTEPSATRAWEEGKVLIFDDSFEHEVWQDAASFRLIFIVDVWHPELTPQQRRSLPAI
ncbi:hypothetical protein CB1_000844034 [Camelus ferus]|nr:hypothetical protein CB1_000844034 [Camelus ferus]